MKKKLIYIVSIVIVFGIMLILFSSFLNNKRINKELSNLQASAYAVQDIKVYEKDSLPKPIKEYLPIALHNKFNTQRMAETEYTAESTDEANKEESVKGKCYYAIFLPGFFSIDEGHPFPLTWKTIRKFYITGNGSVLEKSMSMVTTNSAKGADIDKSELMNYIAGSPFVPWIFFNRSIFTYTSFDSSTVKALITDNEVKFNVVFRFENKRIVELSTTDNSEAGSPQNKLIVKYSNYLNMNDVDLPTQIEAIWSLNGKIYNHIKYNITTYKFY
jgi:hypothetical protein